MSSSAFFIEAAANTVRVLSSAAAGETAAPAAGSRRRRIVRQHGTFEALHACLRARLSRAQIRRRFDRNATRGSAVPAIPMTYGARGCRWGRTITGWPASSKAADCLLSPIAPIRTAGSRSRSRFSLAPETCSTKGLRRELVFHGLADAVAIGGAAEGLGLEEMPVLHHVDPGARRQADGVDAGLRRGLETGEAGKRAVLRRALGRRRQFGIGRRRPAPASCRSTASRRRRCPS